VHESWEVLRESLPQPRWFAFTTRSSRLFGETEFRPDDVFVFGPETRGLPEEVLATFDPRQRLRLPMRTGSRSLNLSNAVAVVVYEAWRQNAFRGGS
jgi:tRNA (cytidine/uridine-2'-O-)-methyltransferase